MAYQMTFKRCEVKYLLSLEQKERILRAMIPYMSLDAYGRTTIRNIYFDTPNYQLIRRSIEKPVYKEKLRLRSYKAVSPEEPIFVELKKKYQSIVYKRRLNLPEGDSMYCFENGLALPVHSQIAEEINAFRALYQELQPTVFLSYEREAYYALDGSDFRVTFDENILFRTHNLSLRSGAYGTALTVPNQTVMEIKTAGGIPLWMVDALTHEKLYPTSFSKYGAAYIHMMENRYRIGGRKYA